MQNKLRDKILQLKSYLSEDALPRLFSTKCMKEYYRTADCLLTQEDQKILTSTQIIRQKEYKTVPRDKNVAAVLKKNADKKFL